MITAPRTVDQPIADLPNGDHPALPLPLRTYRYIAQTYCTNGLTPTVREIQQALGICSPSHVHYLLQALQQQGLLISAAGRTRGITIPFFQSAQRQWSPLRLHSHHPTDLCFQVQSEHYLSEHLLPGDLLFCQPASVLQAGNLVVAMYIPSLKEAPRLTLVRTEGHDDDLHWHTAEQDAHAIDTQQWQRDWLVLGTVSHVWRTL